MLFSIVLRTIAPQSVAASYGPASCLFSEMVTLLAYTFQGSLTLESRKETKWSLRISLCHPHFQPCHYIVSLKCFHFICLSGYLDIGSKAVDKVVITHVFLPPPLPSMSSYRKLIHCKIQSHKTCTFVSYLKLIISKNKKLRFELLIKSWTVADTSQNIWGKPFQWKCIVLHYCNKYFFQVNILVVDSTPCPPNVHHWPWISFIN